MHALVGQRQRMPRRQRRLSGMRIRTEGGSASEGERAAPLEVAATHHGLRRARILAARRADELPHDASARELIDSSTGSLAQRARCMLHAVTRAALDQLCTVAEQAPDVPTTGFEAAARDFCDTRRTILERACER